MPWCGNELPPLICRNTNSGILTLGLLFFPLWHLVHQMHHHIVHRKLLHWYCLQGGDQTIIRHQPPLQQVITMFWSLIGTSKQSIWSANSLIMLTLSNKSLFLHFAREKLLVDEEDIGQILHLWILQSIFQASVGSLQLFMCANWLSAKLRRMINKAFFFSDIWYIF